MQNDKPSISLSHAHFIPEDIRADVVALQQQVSTVNEYTRSHERLYIQQAESSQQLKQSIQAFNFKQYLKLKSKWSKDPAQICSSYLHNHEYVHATLRHSRDSKEYTKTFIVYSKKDVDFTSCLGSNPPSPIYLLVRNTISSLAHCCLENMHKPINGRYPIGRSISPELVFSDDERVSEYIFYPQTLSKLNITISTSNTQSPDSVRRILTKALCQIFGIGTIEVTNFMCNDFLFSVSTHLPVDSLINRIFYIYVSSQGNDDNTLIYNPGGYITRHVARCVNYSKDKQCNLLDQPCHSSTDCAFYCQRFRKTANPGRTTFEDDW